MFMKKSMTPVVVTVLAGVVMTLSSGCSASANDDSGAPMQEVVSGAQVTLATGRSVGEGKAVQILHVAAAENTDIKTTPSVVPEMFETVECPYASSQYTFSEAGTWPNVTMESAKNNDEPGYYIHVEQVPMAIMMRVNEMVPAGNGIDSAHLVEAWKVFNMPKGHGGQEDFFVRGNDMGEYPDNAASYVLACGVFSE